MQVFQSSRFRFQSKRSCRNPTATILVPLLGRRGKSIAIERSHPKLIFQPGTRPNGAPSSISLIQEWHRTPSYAWVLKTDMLLKGYFRDGANSLALRTKITD